MNELLAEEIRFKTAHGKDILPLPNHTALAVPPKFQTNFQNKQRVKTAIDECSFCHQKGHWKTQCPKLTNKQVYGRQQYWKKNGDRQTAAVAPSIDEQS